jgi:GntR family transcriptional repressor for pyruvate dehydrogenase complex
VAAAVLRDEILSHQGDEEQWFLGSEDQLEARLGISRPTLRQAARLLESEQLLVARRGIGGGLFGRRPTASVVTRITSVFLASERTTLRDLFAAHLVVLPATAQIAARAPRPARMLIRDFGREKFGEASFETLSGEMFWDACTEFPRLLASATGSPVMHLFVNVLMDLAMPLDRPERDEIYDNPEMRRVTATSLLAVAEAIGKGEADPAGRLMTAHQEWFINNLSTGAQRTLLMTNSSRARDRELESLV